jgi:hypothetical protein
MADRSACAAGGENADHRILGSNHSCGREPTDHCLVALLQRLREIGWIEGRTIAIEYTRVACLPDVAHLAGSARGAQVVPSYKRGVRLTDLAACLPDFAVAAIREALPAFDRQIKGFALHDAMLTGVETRTSSPIRIRRDNTYQSLNTRGLYPAGEGAGYAGGILSAGVDGIRIAEAVALTIARTEVVQNNRL